MLLYFNMDWYPPSPPNGVSGGRRRFSDKTQACLKKACFSIYGCCQYLSILFMFGISGTCICIDTQYVYIDIYVMAISHWTRCSSAKFCIKTVTRHLLRMVRHAMAGMPCCGQDHDLCQWPTSCICSGVIHVDIYVL